MKRRRTCPPGQIRRKAYTRKDGVHVPSSCIKDRGAPGKGPKVVEITREGKLGGPGYLSKPDRERHRLLRECVAAYGYRSCLPSLNALGVFRKRGPVEQRERIDADREWLVDHFGGPGSFTMRRNKARSQSVREYVMVGDGVYPVDSAAQLRRAKQAMREHGVESTSVWYGHPDDPSSYRGERILSVSGSKLMRRNASKRQTPTGTKRLTAAERRYVSGVESAMPRRSLAYGGRKLSVGSHSADLTDLRGRGVAELAVRVLNDPILYGAVAVDGVSDATLRALVKKRYRFDRRQWDVLMEDLKDYRPHRSVRNPFTGPPIDRPGKVGHVHQYRNPVRGPQYETWDEGECEELYVRVGNKVYRVDKNTEAAENAMRAAGLKEVEVWSGWPGKKGSTKKEGVKLVLSSKRESNE